jgi:hypothetical protein
MLFFAKAGKKKRMSAPGACPLSSRQFLKNSASSSPANGL